MSALQSLVDTGRAIQAADPKLKQLKKASQDLEAHFFKQLLQTMHKGMKETHFGTSEGSEIYQDMQDEAYANAMAQTGGLGIAKMVFHATSKPVLQEAFTQLARKPSTPISTPPKGDKPQ